MCYKCACCIFFACAFEKRSVYNTIYYSCKNFKTQTLPRVESLIPISVCKPKQQTTKHDHTHTHARARTSFAPPPSVSTSHSLSLSRDTRNSCK